MNCLKAWAEMATKAHLIKDTVCAEKDNEPGSLNSERFILCDLFFLIYMNL